MMSSGRGPGVIGMVMALVVLLGFGVLFLFAFDEGFQGGDQSIESVIAAQGREIINYQNVADSGRKSLALAPARLENSKELTRLKRENQTLQENITALQEKVSAGKADLVSRNEAFEGYKDEYRAYVRGKAKGETMVKLETVSGIVYKNVNIREVSAIGIQIRHDDGQKRIPFEELPEEMKDHFQFDAKQKEEALAAESAGREEHEAAVAVSDKQADLDLAAKRVKDAEAAKIQATRTIAIKSNRIKELTQDIERLNDAILVESKKTVSRASILRGEIAGKRREIAELSSQISSLKTQM